MSYQAPQQQVMEIWSVGNMTATHAKAQEKIPLGILKAATICCDTEGEPRGCDPLAVYVCCCLTLSCPVKTACCPITGVLSLLCGGFKNPLAKELKVEIDGVKSDPYLGYDPTQGGGGAMDCSSCETWCVGSCVPFFSCCDTVSKKDGSYYPCLPDCCKL